MTKLLCVLSVLAVLGSSSGVMGAVSNSSSLRSPSRMTLIVKIYRTSGTNTQLQQFNISLSEFSSILQRLSTMLDGMKSSPLNTQLSDYVKQLQEVIPKIVKNPQDEDSIRNLSANLLQLVNGLGSSNDSNLLSILQRIETSFGNSRGPAVIATSVARRRLRRVCRKRKANTTIQGSIVVKPPPKTIVVRVNISPKTQVENLNRTLTTLAQSSRNPSVVKVLNQLISTLTSYTRTRDPSKLMQIMQLTLQLMRLSPSDEDISGLTSNLAAFVSSLLGSSTSVAHSSPLSQLVGYLTSLTRGGMLSPTQSNGIFNVLAQNGVNDGTSLLQTLIAILRPLSTRIPSRINGTSQVFLRELYKLPNNRGFGTPLELLKALQNLVNDVSRYDGADREAVMDVLRLVITVLLSVLGDNPYASGTLRRLLPVLRTPVLRSRQPPRQCEGRMRGLLDLGGIVCTVENVLTGPTRNSGLVGTVRHLLGGVLGGNAGQGLLGGTRGMIRAGGFSTGSQSIGSGDLFNSLFGGIVG